MTSIFSVLSLPMIVKWSQIGWNDPIYIQDGARVGLQLFMWKIKQ